METGRTLIHIVPSNKWGGIQSYALAICRHFAEEGWSVSAFTRGAGAVDRHFREAGIRILNSPLRGSLDITSALDIARAIKMTPLEEEVIIHTHRYRDAMTAIIARRLARHPKVKVITTRHTLKAPRISPLFRRLYKRIDTHIFVSDLAYDIFRKTLWKIPLNPNSLFILRNSIYPKDIIEDNSSTKSVGTAIYFGSIVKGKGLETLIDALALIKDTKLRIRIAGPGNPDYIDQLRRRAIACNVMNQIDWKISSDNIDLHHYLFGIDSSITPEACGITNFFYMAAGIPQIASSSGAQTEYLDNNKTALIVPPSDASALASAMRILTENQELRESLSSEATALYKRLLCWDVFSSSLKQIYTR